MKTGILLVVLLALSAAARPANRLDVCSMKPKEIDEAEIDRYTRIHIPLGKDMTCEEYLSCDLQERERISKCNVEMMICGFEPCIVSEGEPRKSVKWTHVLVKCERLLGSTPAEPAPPSKEDIKQCAYCPPSMVDNPPPAMQKFRIVNPYVPSGPCWCEYYEIPVPAYKN